MRGVHTTHHHWMRATPRVVRIPAKPPTICEACREPSLAMRETRGEHLCPQCIERTAPHKDGDPYDVVGGEA